MIGVGALIVLSGWIVIEIANRTADGRLGPNGWAGVRTRATRSSDEAWMTAHHVARRPTVLGGQAAIVTGVLSMPIGLLVGGDDAERATIAWGVTIGAGTAALTALVVFGAVKGHAAAKRIVASQR